VTPAELVLDASALLRGLAGDDARAAALVDDLALGRFVAHSPMLIEAETTNACVRLVRTGRLTPRGAERVVRTAASLVVLHPTPPLSRRALAAALATGLSAYDAYYAVLAELLDLPLVTADRRLADAVAGAILVG
jgi:predicted nucleic acid-binding protein